MPTITSRPLHNTDQRLESKRISYRVLLQSADKFLFLVFGGLVLVILLIVFAPIIRARVLKKCVCVCVCMCVCVC